MERVDLHSAEPLKVITTGQIAEVGRMVLDGITPSAGSDSRLFNPYDQLRQALADGGTVQISINGTDYTLTSTEQPSTRSFVGSAHRD
ncbi:MAG: hypothetical protein AAB459_02095 [Patescibacteria group bacterium]